MPTFKLEENLETGGISLEASGDGRTSLAATLRMVADTIDPRPRVAVYGPRPSMRGQNNRRSTRTDDEVWALACQVWRGASIAAVGRANNVNQSWLGRVVQGRVWPHIRERGVREGLVS